MYLYSLCLLDRGVLWILLVRNLRTPNIQESRQHVDLVPWDMRSLGLAPDMVAYILMCHVIILLWAEAPGVDGYFRRPVAELLTRARGNVGSRA